MKTIYKYISTLMLLCVALVGCEKGNDNWRIISDVQPGTYIVGDATVYSSAATSSLLQEAALDNAPDGVDVTGIYTWLKAGETFNILKVTEEGETFFGKGAVVGPKEDEDKPKDETTGDVVEEDEDKDKPKYETTVLTEGAEGYSVPQDGLYYVVINKVEIKNEIKNKIEEQLTIIPTPFGIIGNATPQGWNKETLLSDISFDEQKSIVTYSLKNVSLTNKEIKFRYVDWGISIPNGDSTVKFHSNLGGAGEDVKPLNSSDRALKPAGPNMSIDKTGTYTVNLKLNLRSGTFSGQAILTGGGETPAAELPTKMFMNGDPYSWDWNNALEMNPVAGNEGLFWGICYLETGNGIKFNSAMAWDGNEFGVETKDPKEFGEYASGKENYITATTGYHLVVVKCELSADKQSVIKTITTSTPRLYVIADCGMGWDKYNDNWLFTEENGIFTSPAVKKGALRIAVRLTEEWEPGNLWQSEFNVFDGKIVFRGNGGDQEAVNVTEGQVVSLDFRNNTGSIK